MKIRDIVNEDNQTKVPTRYRRATRGLHKFSDGDRWNSDYTQYRLGLALAQTDGKTPPTVDKESWSGKSKTAIPYSKVEQDMLKLAYKSVNAKYTDLNHGDLRSQEGLNVNKASPIPEKKKNKYGV